MNGIRLDFRYNRVNRWLFALFGMGRRSSAIVMHADSIDVKMGWAFRAEIPRANITSVTPHTGRVLGWGVHGWRGRWLVNGSSKGLVTLAIEPPVPSRVCFLPGRLRQLTVSLVDPEILLG
ncbi:MAG TPA: hypothetical protein VLA10_04740 [Ilumatobacter sp.]|nr:hypothetical protein [Ilumatobacter sp.]